MSVWLGLLAALFWGVGDFAGGMGAKQAGGSAPSAVRVVLMSHGTSIGVLLLLALTFGGALPHGHILAWGLGAGLMSGLSLSAFYVALSRGAMGASAAVSGLLAAAIPALVSGFADGAPGWRHAVGFVIAGVAIWLIAAASGVREDRQTMLLAVAAGAGFGLYFVALKFAGTGGALWAMTTARAGSIAACTLVLLALRGGTGSIVWGVFRWVLLTALFDTSGNLLYVAATRIGRLDIAAVLASLYPASTILLAGWLLKERLTRQQGLGMAVAVLAVVLIAL